MAKATLLAVQSIDLPYKRRPMSSEGHPNADRSRSPNAIYQSRSQLGQVPQEFRDDLHYDLLF